MFDSHNSSTSRQTLLLVSLPLPLKVAMSLVSGGAAFVVLGFVLFGLSCSGEHDANEVRLLRAQAEYTEYARLLAAAEEGRVQILDTIVESDEG